MTSGLCQLPDSCIKTCHLNGVCVTLSWPWLSLSHRNGKIECDIASMTVLTFLSCCLTLAGGLWSQWPLWCGATGQFWLPSFTSQKSLGLWLEHIFALTWWWPGHDPIHPDGSLQFFSVEPTPSHCPYLAYRILLLFFCISFEWFVWTPHRRGALKMKIW